MKVKKKFSTEGNDEPNKPQLMIHVCIKVIPDAYDHDNMKKVTVLAVLRTTAMIVSACACDLCLQQKSAF